MTALELELLETRGGGPDRHAPAGWEHPRELEQRAGLAPWPVSRTCSTHYTALHASGTRRLSAIRLLVVHSTEGATAAGAASWFANPRSGGSAHVVVDSLECYRTLPPSAIAWGAPGVNLDGWHLELAGYAHWTRTEWLRHRGTLERGAYKLALHSLALKVPLRQLTDAELRRGARGVVSHREVSRVYHGDHTDPGPAFPWDFFMRAAHGYRAELEA